jgi:hypothetical protein
MTNQQAAAKAKKRWGNRFYVRNAENMSSQQKRNENRDRYMELRAEIEQTEADVKLQLSQLDWYQEARKRQQELRKEADKAQSIALYHRFSVGKSNDMFTEIVGNGDTWEEAFADAEKREAR